MATLQNKTSHGHTYWYVVESRRVRGKPRPVVLAYLGKPDDLLRRLEGAAGRLRLRSVSHGAVAALKGVAEELGVVEQLNGHVRGSRRRAGLTVGETLLLVALGRACRPTSKRGWAAWAASTSVGRCFGVDVGRLTSQHFWDQMEAVPVEALATIEEGLLARVVERYGVSLESVFYDTTNFFTFIATDNTRSRLARRGHSKQKRHDLRQLGLALLVSRGERVPLLHELYEGSRPDVRVFPEVLTRLRERLTVLSHGRSEPITLVYDKGNNSRRNQAEVDASPFHYVGSLVPASHRELIQEANKRLEDVELGDGEVVPSYRTQRQLWGAERTLVVMVSERLRQGQLRGLVQHLDRARRRLRELQEELDSPRARRRRREVVEARIEEALKGQYLRQVLRVELKGRSGGRYRLRYTEDGEALRCLAEEYFGRRILMTDRHEWTSAQIIEAYRGQSEAEAAFRDLKNPYHLAVRPAFHWTDHKLHVHTFCCVLGYLLAKVAEMKARRSVGYRGSLVGLLDQLASIRQVTVLEAPEGRGRPRVRTQLETMEPDAEQLARAFGIDG
jgi:transposase